MSLLGGVEQGRCAAPPARPHIGPAVEQQPSERCVSALAAAHQRRAAVGLDADLVDVNSRIAAARQQDPHDVGVALETCSIEGMHAAARRSKAGPGAALEQQLHHLRTTVQSSHEQRRAARLGTVPFVFAGLELLLGFSLGLARRGLDSTPRSTFGVGSTMRGWPCRKIKDEVEKMVVRRSGAGG